MEKGIRKNILFLTLIHHIDTSVRTIFYDLMKKIQSEGHQVYICAPSERRYKRKTHLVENEGMKILKVRTLNIQKTNFIEKGIASILLEYQYLNGIKKVFNDVKFDMILYSTPPINFSKVIHFVKKRDNAISYLLLKDIFPQNAVDMGLIKKGGILHRYFRNEERKLYESSDYIGCMSLANVQYVLKHNPEVRESKIEVNPNSLFPIDLSVDEERKVQLKKEFDLPTDAVVFLYGGNLGKPQGIDFLIQVLNVQKDNNKVFFLIIGAGTEYLRLSTWVEIHNPKNVSLRTKLPKEKYDQLVGACDVGLIFLDRRFTIPNFPSRLLSYLECKMPVLAATDTATDMGSIIEDHQIGFWAESGDLEGFNQKLDQMIAEDNNLQEMGQRGFQLLEEEYSVEVSYRKLISKLKASQETVQNEVKV